MSSSQVVGHLQTVLFEDLLVVDHRRAHDRVGDRARPAFADPELVHERCQVLTYALRGGRVGQIRHRAALDEARRLLVVVVQPDVWRITADEARGERVDTGRVEHHGHFVLRAVVLLDELPHVGDRLGLGEGELDRLPPVGRARGERRRGQAEEHSGSERLLGSGGRHSHVAVLSSVIVHDGHFGSVSRFTHRINWIWTIMQGVR